MLNIKNTDQLMGVSISGTYDDLKEIYEAIGNVLGPDETYDLTPIRILGVCYDLRHCFMGDREVEYVDNNFDEDLRAYHKGNHPDTNVHFSVNILWIEVIFSVLALDDYLRSYENDKSFKSMMKKSDMKDAVKDYYALRRFEDIALVRLYQEKVWKAFRQACGDAAYKRLYKKAKSNNNDYINFSNYKDFCTHYIDELEMKYIYSNPEKREKLLATLVRKIIEPGDDYYDVAESISNYAKENNVSMDQVGLAGIKYPDTIKW